MKKWLANVLSYVTGRPMFMQLGTTIDKTKFKKIPDRPVVNTDSLIFFEVHPDLGVFEVEKVLHEKNQIKYVVIHLRTHSRFIVPKKWFDFFFTEAVNNLDQLDLKFTSGAKNEHH
jgi:hypothetical protein